MIQKDILEHLDYIRSAGRLEYNDYSELHDMVSELEQQPQDGDLISRQAALEAIEIWDSYAKTIERIKQLPSVSQGVKS